MSELEHPDPKTRWALLFIRAHSKNHSPPYYFSTPLLFQGTWVSVQRVTGGVKNDPTQVLEIWSGGRHYFNARECGVFR